MNMQLKEVKKLDCEIDKINESVMLSRDDFLSLKNKINQIIKEINRREKLKGVI